jgi:hypothetical protein
MALSGAISSSLTARELITFALEQIGALPAGETANAEDAAKGLKDLNWMLKTWQADGVCDGWRVEDLEIAWTGAASSATLATNYLDLEDVRERDSDDVDRDLVRYSLREYAAIADKAQAGDPVAYAIRKTRTSLTVYLWPVPAANTTIVANASRVISDVTDLAHDVDIPQEWLETAVYALAARLTIPFGTWKRDATLASKVEERAQALYALMKSFDEETGSLFFAPG